MAVGERLFLETRFSQFFAAHSGGDVNRPLTMGDPVMDASATTGTPLPGPFAGQAMNCRACHLVDEQKDRAGNRTYADFARHSPIPAREDGLTVTPRNSPPLVGASLPRRGGVFLHFDAEFPSDEALVKGTFTGRNFGWLPGEQAQAVAHIARVLREDDGSGDLAQSYGGAYRVVLGGTDAAIPKDFRLPRRFRIDAEQASDAELLDAAARLVTAYMESLTFATDASGAHSGSPYDVFLRKNRLPRKPHAGEAPAAYTRRLRAAVERLAAPRFVDSTDGTFTVHAQPFAFGAVELAGLRTFLATAGDGASAVGNCTACHPAPDFTDFGFHNTGVAEIEYDAAKGAGAFAALAIPSRAARDAAPGAYLPPSPAHPSASGVFRSLVSPDHPGRTDLGLWNVYGNADLASPAQQRRLDRVLCRALERKRRTCPSGGQLDATVGLFKTPGLRDLADSAPYLHTGEKDTLEDVLTFYVEASDRARAGMLRNADAQLANVHIGPDDVAPLAAFLRALTEDYE